jgi:hypothetical protein
MLVISCSMHNDLRARVHLIFLRTIIVIVVIIIVVAIKTGWI